MDEIIDTIRAKAEFAKVVLDCAELRYGTLDEKTRMCRQRYLTLLEILDAVLDCQSKNAMKEELIDIGELLYAWCKKYSKESVSLRISDGVILGKLNPSDKDYEDTQLFINKEEAYFVKGES